MAGRRKRYHFDGSGVPSIPSHIAAKLMRDSWLNDDDLAEADAAIQAAKAAILERNRQERESHKTIGTLDRDGNVRVIRFGDVFPRRARSGE